MEISLLRCPGRERKEKNRNNNKSPGALPASVRQSSKTISQDGGASGWLVEEPPRKTSGALLADARTGGCLGVCAGGGAAGSPQPRVKGKVRPERGGPTGRLGQMREPRGFAIAGPAGVGQSRRRAGAREKPTAASLRPPEGVCSHTPARARTRTLAHTRPAARSGGHGRLARPRGAHKPHPGRGSAPPGRRPPLPGRRKPLGRGRARRPGASPPRAAEAAPRGRARRGWRRPARGRGQRPAAGGARRRRGAGGGRAATYGPGRRAPQSRRGSHARPPRRRCRRRRQGRGGRSADRGLGGDRLSPRPARARP